jgi:GNAT superfamily N-acetyltransferase
MLHQRLEEVALNAWPTLQQVLLDGWILRFAEGYTRRSNSVNPLYNSHRDLMDKIVRCERLYALRGLPCMFRLTPHVQPPDLDSLLEQRGYVSVEPSLVLHLELGREWQHGGSTLLHTDDLDKWLEVFRRLNSDRVERSQTHRLILQAIACKRLLVSLLAGEEAVACGMGVLEEDCFGLFNLVAAPHHRNRGYGTTMLAGMLDWARQQGAVHAYLQVSQGNAPARHLYAKLGFKELFPYWYRMRT